MNDIVDLSYSTQIRSSINMQPATVNENNEEILEGNPYAMAPQNPINNGKAARLTNTFRPGLVREQGRGPRFS
jgi:ATP-dependent helicase YprA (DUF1998 family)